MTTCHVNPELLPFLRKNTQQACVYRISWAMAKPAETVDLGTTFSKAQNPGIDYQRVTKIEARKSGRFMRTMWGEWPSWVSRSANKFSRWEMNIRNKRLDLIKVINIWAYERGEYESDHGVAASRIRDYKSVRLSCLNRAIRGAVLREFWKQIVF